jgi:hypothetical protein
MNERCKVFALMLFVLPGLAIADPISGYVRADGTPLIASSLYTVSHPESGHYTISFASPLQPLASCVVVPVPSHKYTGLPPYVRHLSESGTSCSFQTMLNDTRRPADIDFTFIAMPMSNYSPVGK